MDTYETQLFHTVLAALLHDVGKFSQRTDSIVLTPENAALQSLFCPSHGTEYSHKHALWTYQSIMELFDNPNPTLNAEAIATLAAAHHKPANALQRFLQMADCLSAGADRKTDLEKETGTYKKTPLRPIFPYLLNKQKDMHVEHEWYYPMAEMSVDSMIPRKHPKQQHQEKKEKYKNWNKEGYNEESLSYDALYSQFCKQCSTFFTYTNKTAMPPAMIIAGFLNILRTYFWCIPSDTRQNSDISLYDHSLTTAAFSAALFKYHVDQSWAKDCFTQEELEKKLASSPIDTSDEKKFLLVAGDISGIQSFLLQDFKDSSKGSSKILRGRSFFISMLQKLIVHRILDAVGLPITQKILDAGGNFKLILPNTPDTKNHIQRIDEDIQRFCHDKLQGSLFVVLAYNHELSYNDFMQENYKHVLSESAQRLQYKKRQPLQTVLTQPESWRLNELYNKIQKNHVCTRCGKEACIKDSKEEWGSLCRFFSQEIGMKLPSCNYIGIKADSTKNASSTHSILPGIQVQLYKEIPKDWTSHLAFYKQTYGVTEADHAIPHLDMCTFVPQYYSHDKDNPMHTATFFNSEWYQAYLKEGNDDGDDEILEEGSPVTFKHLAWYDVHCSDKGAPLIGIVKGDVDNLGTLFSEGMDKRASIARYATLSRQLEWFFTHSLRDLLVQEYPSIYTLYSGGDDFCLIGPWFEIIAFIRNFYNKFREYTAYNPAITFSAGIHVIHASYPIARAIRDAEDYLEQAKEAGKNRLCIFNKTLEWGDELDRYLAFSDKLIHQVKLHETEKEKYLTKGFLYRLLNYQRMAGRYIEHNEPEALLFHSHLLYDKERNLMIENPKDRKKRILPVALEFLTPLFEVSDLAHTYETHWKKLDVSIFRALYKLRTKRR